MDDQSPFDIVARHLYTSYHYQTRQQAQSTYKGQFSVFETRPCKASSLVLKCYDCIMNDLYVFTTSNCKALF